MKVSMSSGQALELARALAAQANRMGRDTREAQGVFGPTPGQIPGQPPAPPPGPPPGPPQSLFNAFGGGAPPPGPPTGGPLPGPPQGAPPPGPPQMRGPPPMPGGPPPMPGGPPPGPPMPTMSGLLGPPTQSPGPLTPQPDMGAGNLAERWRQAPGVRRSANIEVTHENTMDVIRRNMAKWGMPLPGGPRRMPGGY